MKNFFLYIFLLFQINCMSAYLKLQNVDEKEQISEYLASDFEITWQATLDALKNYALDINNKDGGFLKTKWKDNTDIKNFTDQYEASAPYTSAQFRFLISIQKTYQETTTITIRKEQLVLKDILEGWKKVASTLVEEKTLLYRIKRLIALKHQIRAWDEKKANLQINNSSESR